MATCSFPFIATRNFSSPVASTEHPLPYPAEEHGAARGFVFGLLIEGSVAGLALLVRALM